MDTTNLSSALTSPPQTSVGCPLPNVPGTSASSNNSPAASSPANGNNPPTTRFTSGSFYSYTQESFSLKYKTSDGDSFELTADRETLEMSTWSQGDVTPELTFPAANKKSLVGEDPDATDAAQPKKDLWSALRDVMDQVKQEMQHQQLQVLKSLLGEDSQSTENLQGLWAKLAASRKAGGDPSQFADFLANSNALPSGDFASNRGGLPPEAYSLQVKMEEMHLHMEWSSGNADGAQPTDEKTPSTVPDYWNAENTSDRIVNFAMQFAALHSEDLEGFMTQIRDAIDLGFAQASQMVGPLQGNAAKLNQDTHQQINDKLDRKLADLQATPYNDVATQTSVNAPTPLFSGMTLDLAA